MAKMKRIFKAVQEFTDLQDNNHKYLVGDEYPRKGLDVSEKRINELLTDTNRRGYPMIEEIELEEVKPVLEPIKEEVTEPEVVVAPTKRGKRK